MMSSLTEHLLSFDESIRNAADRHAQKNARVIIETNLVPYNFHEGCDAHGVEPVSTAHNLSLHLAEGHYTMPIITTPDVARTWTRDTEFYVVLTLKLATSVVLAAQTEWTFVSGRTKATPCRAGLQGLYRVDVSVPTGRDGAVWPVEILFENACPAKVEIWYSRADHRELMQEIDRHAVDDACMLLTRLASCLPKEVCAGNSTFGASRKRTLDADTADTPSVSEIIAAAGADPKQKKLTALFGHQTPRQAKGRARK